MPKRKIEPEYRHPAMIEEHRRDQHAALRHIAGRWKQVAREEELMADETPLETLERRTREGYYESPKPERGRGPGGWKSK